MSKTKIIRSYAESIAVIIQREIIRDVRYFKAWIFHLHMFLIKDHIGSQCQFFYPERYLGLNIFVSGGSRERKMFALKVVDVAIFL